jgi:hypothetical protein
MWGSTHSNQETLFLEPKYQEILFLTFCSTCLEDDKGTNVVRHESFVYPRQNARSTDTIEEVYTHGPSALQIIEVEPQHDIWAEMKTKPDMAQGRV